MDALVLVYEPTFPGCHLTGRVIGLLRMIDEKGEDEKVLAVPAGDPRFDEIHDLVDLREHWLKEIENFFATYKLLEAKETELQGWDDASAARLVIEHARRRYQRRQQDATSLPTRGA